MPDRLDLYQRLKDEVHGFDFFQAVRLLDCAHPEQPRTGTSHRAAEDPVRFGQSADLSFAPSTLDAFEPGKASAPPRLLVRFLGLLGPHGPLPLHLTEYARDRQRNSDDSTFVRFLDVFHHRMLALFYRAWADAQPAVSLDRKEEDRFALYLGALFGLGQTSVRHRDAVPDAAKLHYSGLLSNQARSAEGLQAILSDFLRVPVRVVEFVGHWLRLPDDDRSRIGKWSTTAQLGVSALLGERLRSHQHKFRIVLGAMALERYRALLPGSRSLAQIRDWVRLYASDIPACEVQLVLQPGDVPPLRLGGGAQLGWTSWLPGRDGATAASDLVVTLSS